MAFDRDDFVVSKPSQNAPNLWFRSIFCAMKKLQNVRPSENRRNAVLARLLPFKESILKNTGTKCANRTLSMPSSCLLELRAKTWILGVFRL